MTSEDYVVVQEGAWVWRVKFGPLAISLPNRRGMG